MRAPRAGDGLLHAVPLVAIAALIFNDHILKFRAPSALTGKLSDFAGLAFFPLFLQAGWERLLVGLGRPWFPSRRVLVMAALATGVVFALVKLEPASAELYRWTFGLLRLPLDTALAVLQGRALPAWRPVALAEDPSDLLALPSLALAVWAGWGRTTPS